MGKLKISHLLVLSYVLGSSFILIFASILKDTGMSSVEMVFFRISISLIILFAYMKLRRGGSKDPVLAKRKDIPFFIMFGFFFAVFLLIYVSSVSLGASAVVAGALVYTQPAFTALISRITGKERKLHKKTILAITLSILGAIIVSGISVQDILATRFNIGVILAGLTGLTYAVFLVIKRHAQDRGYPAMRTVFNQLLFATPAVLFVGFILRTFVTNDPLVVGVILPNAHQALLVFGFAIICTAIPYVVIAAVDNKDVSPITEGVLLSVEPILVAVLALVVLGQTVTPIQYGGVILIVAAAMLALKPQKV